MQIFGVKIDKLKYEDLFSKITKLDKKSVIFTPNPEILLKTLVDKEFENILNEADFLTPDWKWLYIAFQILDNKFGRIINSLLLPYYFFNFFFRSKYLYEKYWDRICGSDLTKDLVEFASKNKIAVSIIDLYNPTDAKKVASQKNFKKNLSKIFPDLIMEYYIYNPEEKEKILEEISKNNTQILFSTLWMKKQEASVIEVSSSCENIKIWLWIGSSFDYFTWFQKRAPEAWRKLGLEWLYRLFTWPRKLDRMKRLWDAIFVFTYKVIMSKKAIKK